MCRITTYSAPECMEKVPKMRHIFATPIICHRAWLLKRLCDTSWPARRDIYPLDLLPGSTTCPIDSRLDAYRTVPEETLWYMAHENGEDANHSSVMLRISPEVWQRLAKNVEALEAAAKVIPEEERHKVPNWPQTEDGPNVFAVLHSPWTLGILSPETWTKMREAAHGSLDELFEIRIFASEIRWNFGKLRPSDIAGYFPRGLRWVFETVHEEK